MPVHKKLRKLLLHKKAPMIVGIFLVIALLLIVFSLREKTGTKSKASTPTVSLNIDPTTTTVHPGDTVTATISLDAQTSNVTAVDFHLLYNSAIFQFVEFQDGGSFPGHITNDNSPGDYHLVATNDNGITGNITIGRIVLRAAVVGQSNISFGNPMVAAEGATVEEQRPQVTSATGVYTVADVTPTDTITPPSPTPTDTPVPTSTTTPTPVPPTHTPTPMPGTPTNSPMPTATTAPGQPTSTSAPTSGGGDSGNHISYKNEDLNHDGQVGIQDLSYILSNWGASASSADLSGNHKVDFADINVLLSQWGK